MDTSQMRTILYRAAKLRMPQFAADDPTRKRVTGLEDYLLQVALWRGELEEARLHCNDGLHALLVEWDDIPESEWEDLIPEGRRRRRTQEDVRRAKKLVKPALHDSIREARHLISQLSDQIRRLEKDDATASRTYTLVSGG
jgi:hypothetical protein